jgi:crossover junction endodeoxyribonuclease RusA
LLRLEKKLPLESILGKLDVSIILYPPDIRVRDLDNYFKAPLDALTHARLWGDDSQIKRLSDEWGEKTKGGGFRLIVKPFVERV